MDFLVEQNTKLVYSECTIVDFVQRVGYKYSTRTDLRTHVKIYLISADYKTYFLIHLTRNVIFFSQKSNVNFWKRKTQRKLLEKQACKKILVTSRANKFIYLF